MNIYQILKENCQERPLFALLLGFIIYLMGTLVLLPLYVTLIALVSGLSLEEVQQILGGNFEDNPFRQQVFRLIQGGNQVLTWGLAGGLMAYLLGDPGRVLQLRWPGSPALVVGVVLILSSLPLIQAITFDEASFSLPEALGAFEQWAKTQEAQGQKVLLQVLGVSDLASLLLNLIVFALLPAICEEVFFRGFLLHWLRKRVSVHLAVWVAAAVFSLVHMQFFGFFARLLLGGLLGYLAVASRSLLAAMVAHFAFNAFSILLVYLSYGRGLLAPEVAQDEWTLPWYAVALSALITVGGMVGYFRRYQAL